jgi:hypothetical protein
MSEPILAVQLPAGRGRAYRYPPTGDLFPSVTNCIGILDKPALPRWAAKEVAGAAWDRRDTLMTIDERDEAVDLLKGLPWRKRNKAADVGTIVHSVAEALSMDEPELPAFEPEHEPFVDAFVQFCSDYSPEFSMVEVTIFSEEHRYAGTADFIARFGDLLILGDHKTGSGVYQEVALQLAALRHGETVWEARSGELSPMPAVDGCMAVHLRPRGYAVYPIDADDRAFSAFLGLRKAWEWVKDNQAVGPKMSPARLRQWFSPAAATAPKPDAPSSDGESAYETKGTPTVLAPAGVPAGDDS